MSTELSTNQSSSSVKQITKIDSPIQKHKKKSSDGFNTYIFKVLKQVHPDTRISSQSTRQLSSLLELLAIKISEIAHSLTMRYGKQTITSREIQSAVKLIMPGQLSKHAVSEGTKAVTKYNASVSDEAPEKSTKKQAFGAVKNQKKKPSERSERRAGLTFPVARCKKYIKLKGASGYRIGVGAPVYLAAVLEYICAELLELAGNAARDNKKVTICTRHLFFSVANDEELTSLFSQFNVEFNGSGVLPKIRDKLISQGQTKKATKTVKHKAIDGEKKPHRFRPGTVALREIRTQQKSTKLQIQFSPFERIVRDIIKENNDTLRFSEGVILGLQGFIESCMTHIYGDAQDLACYTNREGINAADILFSVSHSSMGFDKFLIGSTRDSKNQISKEPLLRLARRAGVKRCRNDIYDISRRIIDGILSEILRRAVVIVEHNRSKTLSCKILQYAIQDCGFNYFF